MNIHIALYRWKETAIIEQINQSGRIVAGSTDLLSSKDDL